MTSAKGVLFLPCPAGALVVDVDFIYLIVVLCG